MLVEGRQPATFTARQHLALSCLWFAYNFQWGALLPIVLPATFERIAGPQDKELYNGFASLLGAGVALVVTPLAGALSDRSRHERGRRRPYLLSGVLLNVAFLMFMSYAARGQNVWMYLLSLMTVQFGCNWWGGPYAGLIPDIAPPDQRGRASGYMMVMTLLGSIGGALCAAAFLARHLDFLVYASISVVTLAMLAITWKTIDEPTVTMPEETFSWARFFVNPREHPDFYWVMITRMLIMMGVYPFYTFFQYFLGDVIHMPDAAGATAILLGISTVAAIPSGFLGGSAADRFGRRRIVYVSGFLMALAALAYIGLVYHPSWPMMIAISLFFAAANSIYGAADWALAVDVLPNGADAAKDMGLWHTCMLLPQMLSPGITGVLLSVLKKTSLSFGYTVVFAITAFWFVAGTVLISKVRKIT